MKKLRIMVVCGFGLGSSMVLRLTLDSVLKQAGVIAETFCSDESTSKGEAYDIVFTSQPLARLFEGKTQPTIVINNFLSKDEVRDKGLDLIQKMSTE